MKLDTPYLHGFTSEEKERLRKQARFLEQRVYRHIDFSNVKNVLEVGCGVGAQTEILLRRFPTLNISGIDMAPSQVESAKEFLQSLPYTDGRFDLQQMDAGNMDFESSSFDGAFICWLLEHVPEPRRVLSEVRRVLKPGAAVYLTEVMNSSFFLDPYSPNTWKYWMAFNDYQYDQAGDPFIGAKLGNLLMEAGFRDVQTEIISMHLDNRRPSERKEIIEYWRELLLSAKDQLLKANCVDEETVAGMIKELDQVRKDPNAVFLYSFMQAKGVSLN